PGCTAIADPLSGKVLPSYFRMSFHDDGVAGEMAQHAPYGEPKTLEGVGKELHLLFSQIGFAACPPCMSRMYQMNRMGVQGCKDAREELLAQLRVVEAAMGWLAKWSQAPRAAMIIPMRHW